MAQTLRDPRMRIMLFVMPVIQMTLFGLAISSETRNIKLAAVYQPNDLLARRLEERCLKTGWFVPASPEKSGDPFQWIQSGRADAVLVAPEKGLTRAGERGGGEIQLLVGSRNINKGRSAEA